MLSLIFNIVYEFSHFYLNLTHLNESIVISMILIYNFIIFNLYHCIKEIQYKIFFLIMIS